MPPDTIQPIQDILNRWTLIGQALGVDRRMWSRFSGLRPDCSKLKRVFVSALTA